MSESSIAYAADPDTNPEAELFALANIYKFVLDCHTKKEATHPGSPDDARKDQDAGTCTHCT
jgi:hypothetical protein